MKRLLFAAAALMLTGCSAAAAPHPGQAGGAAPRMTSPAQSFDFTQPNGYQYRFAIQVGQASPTAATSNCPGAGMDAGPGFTNVPVVVTVTNLLTDRNAPAALVQLGLPQGEHYDLLIGADEPGASCGSQLSPGRWMGAGESVVLRGYVRGVPDPIPAAAFLEFDDMDGSPVNGLHVLLKQ